MKNMDANARTKPIERESASCTAVSRAIACLQSYVDKEPYTNAATEARTVIDELKAVRRRPAVDELLALMAQIAQTDHGVPEINRAIRMRQPEQTTERKRTGKEV